MQAELGSALAAARCRAHAAFDPLWQSGRMTRSEAYTWLAATLGVRRKHCHMLQFDEHQCEQVVHVCTQRSFRELGA